MTAPAGPSAPCPAPDDRSWWLDEALAAEGRQADLPPPQGRHEADVAIVGGGFTGLWTALLLRQRAPDLRVVLLEARICGAGASGMNGGMVHGYWGALSGLSQSLGADQALEAARLGSRAQDALRAFATAPGRDLWWQEGGILRLATTPEQEARRRTALDTAARLGAPDSARGLSRDETLHRLGAPAALGGILFAEGATVQPARLARALRRACLDAGVTIHEHSPVAGVEDGTPCRLRLPSGAEVLARQVVLATNAALARHPAAAAHLAVFSSYAVMSAPVAGLEAAAGWPEAHAAADMRMFVHYFRKAQGGRVLMGSGSGPIARGGRHDDPAMSTDRAAAERAAAALSRLLPGLAGVAIDKAWGGAIDVTPDRLPFFHTLPGGRIHIGAGYSGHGVNPTRIGGECLSGLVLGLRNDWTGSLFCRRPVPRFPPEPLRSLGGRMVRAAILSGEEAMDLGRSPSAAARLGAWLPRALGLRIGMR